MTTCIVSVSGGAASAIALERALAKHNEVVAVFADTKTEDADLYRFLDDTEKYLGIEIIRLADGRNVWQLFFDEKFIGNTRVDLCSRILKRDIIRTFIESRYTPNNCILSFGMGPSEITRSDKLKQRWQPYQVWCPLQEPPFLERCALMDRLIDVWDIDPPRLYDEGFKHNNCGGACVKAGHGGWLHLLRKRPATFAYWEEQERQFRELHGDVAILRDRRGGVTRPMSLQEFRRRVEEEAYRPTDAGEACNCMGN